MNGFKKVTRRFLLTIVVLSSLSVASAEEIPTGYNTPIPGSIMTPDKVETRIGTLNFFDGVPSKETAELALDNLVFLRGVEAFLNGVPMASIHALVEGYKSIGVTEANHMIVTDKLMDSNPLFLTANTDTVYAFSFFDLEKTGPLVIEVPPGTGPGTVNDAFFRFVVDMGMPGPDRGKGGKYLILPPGYDQVEPEGYFIARSPSYINLFVLRGFLVDGKPDEAAKMFSEQVRVYPLSEKTIHPRWLLPLALEFHIILFMQMTSASMKRLTMCCKRNR